jgi:hypothetical protein
MALTQVTEQRTTIKTTPRNGARFSVNDILEFADALRAAEVGGFTPVAIRDNALALEVLVVKDLK